MVNVKPERVVRIGGEQYVATIYYGHPVHVKSYGYGNAIQQSDRVEVYGILSIENGKFVLDPDYVILEKNGIRAIGYKHREELVFGCQLDNWQNQIPKYERNGPKKNSVKFNPYHAKLRQSCEQRRAAELAKASQIRR